MDADPATLTEPERRAALLDWLARGRDVRIAAETHDWAKDIAQAAGHPDRDQIRQALAAAKAELHPPRQLLKPDSIAPVRPRIPAPTAEEIEAFAAVARADAPVVDHVPCGDPEHCAAGGECIDYADELPDEQADALAAAEHLADVVEHAIDESGGVADVDRCTRRPDCPWTGGGECGDCLGDNTFDDVLADVVDHAIETGEPLLDDPATCQHKPRVVLEGRLWHAVCAACGTTWHRTRCTAPDCGAYVSAEYVARTGSTRHDWHPKEQS